MNPPATVVLPAGVVTTTGTLPTGPGGVVPVSTVPMALMDTPVAGTPLKVTVAPVRLVPMIANAVPPAVEPLLGTRAVTVGPLGGAIR